VRIDGSPKGKGKGAGKINGGKKGKAATDSSPLDEGCVSPLFLIFLMMRSPGDQGGEKERNQMKRGPTKGRGGEGGEGEAKRHRQGADYT